MFRAFGVLFIAILLVVPITGDAQFLSPEERTRLEAEYQQLQKEIAEWQKVLDETRAKKNTIQGDVTALTAQIKQAEAQIKQKNLAISKLSTEIKAKTARIGELSIHMEQSLESLASLLRQKNEMDNTSLVTLALGADDFTAFFVEADAIIKLQGLLQQNIDELRGVKAETEQERAALAEKQDAEIDARYVVETKKQQVAKSETEKKSLLAITKNQESEYQKVLAERERRAEAIRTALFDLRDSAGIPFGTALDYATFAGEKTGVRTAVILAILSQESDLGKNVGSCYVTDLSTGAGVGKNTGKVFPNTMKAPRDTVPFERITRALGLTWATTPVSCAAGGGYGGAMGPSQFIPSTWELFASRLKTSLGVSEPNPWDAKHAIMATATYLKDLGAAGQTYTSERNAACRYYSGRACDTKRPTNYTYGNSVMTKAAKFQEDIDFLKGV
ncbi:MAG: lytic murein transglycosylase [bacterium]|nr:lytic murein transglycosylase [bacterium]